MTEEKREETLLGKELERAGFDPDGVRKFAAFEVEAGAYLSMGLSIGFIIVGIFQVLVVQGLEGFIMGPLFILGGIMSFVLSRMMAKTVKKKGK